jgi:hypothetical protein
MTAKTLFTVAGALVMTGCTPDWASNGESPMVLLLTDINAGSPISSDVRISSGTVCPDLVPVRIENHFKNPLVDNTGYRGDIVIERYEVRYIRSDGRDVEGVDVPFRITGSVAQEIIAPGAATLQVEVVRRQAKVEAPLANLRGGGGPAVVTMFAEVTLHARSTIGQTTNPARGRLQIDFADYVDDADSCP